MKKWNIPVSWEVCGIVTIEADTLKEAMDKIRKDDSIPLDNKKDVGEDI